MHLFCTDDFMIPRYKETCNAVLSQKDHKNKIIRAYLITLIPTLSSYCTDIFIRLYLDDSMDILIKYCKQNVSKEDNLKLRSLSLLSIGE